MKKKLSSAKAPLPKFESDKAAAEYFDQHSVAGIWNQLPEAKPVKLSAALAKKIRDNAKRGGSAMRCHSSPTHSHRNSDF
jgi:hypothetical protein